VLLSESPGIRDVGVYYQISIKTKRFSGTERSYWYSRMSSIDANQEAEVLQRPNPMLDDIAMR
jgi:hypothetical protein